MATMRVVDVAELVRLPAALTVPGDAWTGAAHAEANRRAWAMPAASVLLYWSGMALNDWADRDVDARERPERPIPSGRVPADTALLLAVGLGAAGLTVSALVGGPRALRVSVPLAALVGVYDVVAKDSALGPVVMSGTRGLDILLGAYGDPRAALAPAAASTLHTVALTALSRGEVHGSSRATARLAATTTAAVAGLGVLAALGDRDVPRRHRATSALLSAGYAAVVGRAQLVAAASPDAETVRRATGAGIAGFPLLQASWLVRRGRWQAAAVVLAARPALKMASRRMSTT
ncbi:SCO3242 family prenyltransferase [Nocardioides sp.]|uniref:SCO3242 family prenyltransferase n=1 Tax=Nocardioides sp. TaxID=35761 RepID=UPI0027374182|nr:UbiA family prenyltransferase [Nocardioides sp.]MDP3890722.1 UbiA family prenyltransferase [Nocardioides sp.]